MITDAVAKRLGSDPSPGPRNTGPDVVASNIVAFGGSILALGDGSLAYELTRDLDTLRRVDLAGQSRGLAAYPKRDPITGDLHLLAVGANGAQAHVVVSSGALTRTSRPILEHRTGSRIWRSPATASCSWPTASSVSRLATARVASRGSRPVLDAPDLVHAHDVGDTVVVYAVTPSLERWTLHPASATVHRDGTRSDTTTLRPPQRPSRRRAGSLSVGHRRRDRRQARSRHLDLLPPRLSG